MSKLSFLGMSKVTIILHIIVDTVCICIAAILSPDTSTDPLRDITADMQLFDSSGDDELLDELMSADSKSL